jgi:DNA-binding MarR family transcriptional regulator
MTPCLCDSLRQATRAVTRMYDDALRPVKLRITQYTVLSCLVAMGEARVRDLSASLLIEETTLTRSLKPLQENGWIQSRSGDDRRERYVSVTPAGRQLLAKATPLWNRAQAALRTRISQSGWDELFRALPRVAEAAIV